MKSLKESLFKAAAATMQDGDDYMGLSTFPAKTDFIRHSSLKGYRCTWLFPAIKNIYEKELKSYLASSRISNWILPKFNEIQGISVHVKKDGDKKYGIEVYLEGIDRGQFTDIGTILPHIFGYRDSIAKAKDAAYEFLCKIKNDEKFFKNVLHMGEIKERFDI